MMRRPDNQQARPTAGCLSVPLFNQKKRGLVPLTSAPSENEFFSHREYTRSASSATPSNDSGIFERRQMEDAFSGASPSPLWNKPRSTTSSQPQQYGKNRPAPTAKVYKPLPHPYKPGGMSSRMEQPSNPLRQQDTNSIVNSRQNRYQASCSSQSAQSKQTPRSGVSGMGQASSYGPANFTNQRRQRAGSLPPPVPAPSRPSASATQQKNKWNFTNSFGPQGSTSENKRDAENSQTTQQSQDKFPVKSTTDYSLRILTAVIDGMRHWNQYKDKVPCLFEIFATLDSAVTVGHHGAKNFLIRDGKRVVQCLFYENEQELPRLVRGQVLRCVGNYESSRDTLVCVSVRPAQPSEQRNAQQAVQVCDAEMRMLVKSFSEL